MWPKTKVVISNFYSVFTFKILEKKETIEIKPLAALIIKVIERCIVQLHSFFKIYNLHKKKQLLIFYIYLRLNIIFFKYSETIYSYFL